MTFVLAHPFLVRLAAPKLAFVPRGVVATAGAFLRSIALTFSYKLQAEARRMQLTRTAWLCNRRP
jgi:hypothetical protein